MAETNVSLDAETIRDKLKEIGKEREELVGQRAALVAIRDKASAEIGTVAEPFKATVTAYAAAIKATVEALDTHLEGLVSTAATLSAYVTEQVGTSTETGATLATVETPVLRA